MADAPKVPTPEKAPAPQVPAHKGENAVTRDTTPSVERPGHEIEHPERPKNA